MRATESCRLAVVASHPIQYFTPLYRELAKYPGLEISVFFCSDFGVRARYDRRFAQTIVWNTDQLTGYTHHFLASVSPIRNPFNPLHAINPGAFVRLLWGFDALWINGYLYPSNWLAAAAAAIRRMPLLLRSDMSRGLRGERWYDTVRDGVLGWWVRRADALLYVGEANKAAYRSFGARDDRLFSCPFAVDVEHIAATTARVVVAREAFLKAWRLPHDRVLILFAGKLWDVKQPRAMLDIASDVEVANRIHVVFAGSGPLAESLRDECNDRGLANVTFLGFVNQANLAEVYSLADIYVMPSTYEPWGLALNEAMAAGAASVVSDAVGAVPDLITEGETGFTFPSGDWSAMLAQVRRLVRSRDLRAEIGKAARTRSARYNYAASVDGILNALSTLGKYSEHNDRSRRGRGPDSAMRQW